jgi:hypothetical protein
MINNKNWTLKEIRGDVKIYTQTTKFNFHPDSPNIYGFGFLKNNFWRNYVNFNYDECIIDRYYDMFNLEYIDNWCWNFDIEMLKLKGIV